MECPTCQIELKRADRQGVEIADGPQSRLLSLQVSILWQCLLIGVGQHGSLGRFDRGGA